MNESVINYYDVSETVKKIHKSTMLCNNILNVLNMINSDCYSIKYTEIYVIVTKKEKEIMKLNKDDTNTLAAYSDALINIAKKNDEYFSIFQIQLNNDYIKRKKQESINTKDVENMVKSYTYVTKTISNAFKNNVKFTQINMVKMNDYYKLASGLYDKYELPF